MPAGQTVLVEEESKSCCGVPVSQTVSIRWFIVMIAFVGICCAVVGTVLGAMKASGREHLTVSLLMIGEWREPSQAAVSVPVSIVSHSVPQCPTTCQTPTHPRCGRARVLGKIAVISKR